MIGLLIALTCAVQGKSYVLWELHVTQLIFKQCDNKICKLNRPFNFTMQILLVCIRVSHSFTLLNTYESRYASVKFIILLSIQCIP